MSFFVLSCKRVLLFLVSLLVSGAGMSHAAPARRPAKARYIANTLTQHIVPVEEGQLSPDGRWIAFFSNEKKRFNLYNFETKRTWRIAVQSNPDSYQSNDVAWHPQSHMLVISTAKGWVVLWPYQRRKQRITRIPAYGESSAAWAAQGTKLALFEGEANLLMWDGHKVTNLGHWGKLVGYPYGEERAWQSTWSPDGKKLLLRFYGHAQRDSDQPGHTFILDPRTGRPLYKWGAESAPAQWLDNERLIYSGDLFKYPLTVSKPRAHIDNVWGPYVLWTLSPRRDTIYTLDIHSGILRRTSSRVKHWSTLQRFKLPPLSRDEVSWGGMQLSPRGDWLALYSDKTLVLYNIYTRQTISWKSRNDTFKLIGWTKGHALPLIDSPWGSDTSWQVRQLSLPSNASRR